MDRQIVYIGQVPMDTDILNTNLNCYVAFTKLAGALLGTSTQLNGLACAPTSPASMAVTIGPGEIYALEQIDTNPYGSLPTNSTVILKQGINLQTITTSVFTPPSTSGYSQNFLIEFAFNEVDGGSEVLPYYNSAEPSQAFSGPNNDSQPNYTVRQDRVAYQIKAGTAAPSGTQTTPSPDSGYVGGWVVTVPYGATTLTTGNIAQYPSAPFIVAPNSTNLVSVVALQAGQYLYGADTGTVNNIAVTLSPAITSYSTGSLYLVKIANTNTGTTHINFNGVGSVLVRDKSTGLNLLGGELVAGGIYLFSYDGTEFQLQNPSIPQYIQNNTYTYGSDIGSVNAYQISIQSPVAPSAYASGQIFYCAVAHTNTSTSCTFEVNSIGTVAIHLADGRLPAVGDIQSGMNAIFYYNGTNFLLLNPCTTFGIQNSSYVYGADSGTANTYAVALSPPIAAYATGQYFVVKIANTNTSSTCTLNANSLGTKTIHLVDGRAPAVGDIRSGMMAIFYYDGTNMQLINPAVTLQIQNNAYNYASDTGSANAYAFALSPAISAYVAGQYYATKITNTNTSTSCTVNINSLGTKTIHLVDGRAPAIGDIQSGMMAVFYYDGTNMQLVNPAVTLQIQNGTYEYAGVDSGSVNAYAGTLSPAIASYVAGAHYVVKISNTNTSTTCTLNLNSLGVVTIKLPGGNAPGVGQIAAGMMAIFYYDGTYMQLINPTPLMNTNIQTFASSGTYTPTVGMQFCTIEAVGGGGGGGGVVNSGSTTTYGGAGGGSGSYSRTLATATQIGSSQTVTIGSAGTGGANTGGTGGAGGNTSVGSLCIANGGSGGAGLGGGGAAKGGAGGTVGTGTFTCAGNPGGSVGSTVTSDAAAVSGFGASSYFGGGVPGQTSQGAGANGGNYGAGGSGAISGNAGGAAVGGTGSAGYVLITEYIF